MVSAPAEESEEEIKDDGVDGADQLNGSSDDDDGGSKKGKGPDPHALLSDGKKQKEIGFGAYRVGNYEKAIECWSMARGTMKHILEKKLFDGNADKLEETRELETTLWSNLAQAYLKNKEFYQAISFCNSVLERRPNDVKALYRKASALIMGADYLQARNTVNELLKLEPDNAGAKQLLLDIKRREDADRKSYKKAVQKMFSDEIGTDPRIREEEPTFIEQLTDSLKCTWCRRRKTD